MTNNSEIMDAVKEAAEISETIKDLQKPAPGTGGLDLRTKVTPVDLGEFDGKIIFECGQNLASVLHRFFGLLHRLAGKLEIILAAIVLIVAFATR